MPLPPALCPGRRGSFRRRSFRRDKRGGWLAPVGGSAVDEAERQPLPGRADEPRRPDKGGGERAVAQAVVGHVDHLLARLGK
eukprot:scaffold6389_cov108-Isochrysis_galbana.AAC.1